MKTEIRPFRAEDMETILKIGVKEFGLKCLPNDHIKALAQQREESKACITGLVDDVVVGIGGIETLWSGVGEVWLMLSYEVDKRPMRTYDIISAGLDKLIKDNNLWRCQGWCRAGFTKAHTLFRHLNFQPEGIARKYLPDGSDAILYSRIT